MQITTTRTDAKPVGAHRQQRSPIHRRPRIANSIAPSDGLYAFVRGRCREIGRIRCAANMPICRIQSPIRASRRSLSQRRGTKARRRSARSRRRRLLDTNDARQNRQQRAHRYRGAERRYTATLLG